MRDNSVIKYRLKQIIFWSILLGGILALFVPVFAQSLGLEAYAQDVCDTFNTNSCLAGTPRGEGTADPEAVGNNVVSIIISIAVTLTYISAAVAVIFIVIGGFLMITSAGDNSKYKAGLDTLKNAIIGLVITVLAYTIVFIVGQFVSRTDVLCNTSDASQQAQGC